MDTRRFFFILAMLICACRGVHGAGDVTVNTNTYRIVWPPYTTFIASNNIATNQSGFGSTNQWSYEAATNVSHSELVAGTNAAVNLATSKVASVGYLLPASTSTLVTATQLSTATNTTVQIATNAAFGAVSNDLIWATNLLTKINNTTNTYATTTSGVQRIVVGTTNCTGYVTFTGAGIIVHPSNNGSNLQFGVVEYISKNIVPTNGTYEILWDMPRDEGIYLEKVYGQTDAGTCEFDIISKASNTLWRGSTKTNTTSTLTAITAGIVSESFSAAGIGAGSNLGFKVQNVWGAQNLTVGVKIRH